MHDDLGQQLKAPKMGIAALEGQLAAGNESLPRSPQRTTCNGRLTP
ncbi:hypothetical protein [Burkholderia sp. 4M9327F10]|nr:hypothetical protein [Burkholderia sp. 4M9327F10]